jgi:hypothetical protein
MIGATLAAAVAFVVFVAGAGALSTSPSGFESNDGGSGLAANMTVEGTTSVSNGSQFADWNCFANGKATGFVASGINVGAGSCSSKLVYANALQHADADAGTANDVGWVSGQKMDLVCAKTTPGNQPAKDTFVNVAQYNETASNNHVFLYGGTIRSTANGNANENIELSHAAGTSACPINRSDGDKLLQFNYSGSGSVSLQILTFYMTALPSGVSSCFSNSTKAPPCWANPVNANSTTNDGGTNNANTINAADNGISGQTLGANLFAEFGVDLTSALGDDVSCQPFAQETWESRSSSSFSSNPEDIEIINHTISQCGSITIVKHTNPGGLDQVFNYTSSGFTANASAGGVTCAGKSGAGINSDGTFCLNDKTSLNTGTGTANHVTEGSLLAGNYTVTEGADPTGFAFESLTCYGGPYGGDATHQTNIYNAGTTTYSKSVTIALASGDNVTCTYTNKRQTGAILITKTGKYKGCSTQTAGSAITVNSSQIGVCGGSGALTTAKLGGATFKITTDAAGSSVITGAGSLTTDNTTGTVCFDGLPLGDYYVTETAPPSGYSKDLATAVKVNVTVSGTCNSTTPANTAIATGSSGVVATGYTGAGSAPSFSDTPLTSFAISATSQTGSATKSTITCTGPSPGTSNISGSPAGPSASPSISLTGSSGLAPGTYTCTVAIDP